MSKTLALLLMLSTLPAWAKPPRLTLLVVVDAMGSDLLMRMKPRLKFGLATLTDQGAYYPTARYEQAETVTAIGHATLATGANPWRHGLVGNHALNRSTGKVERALADANHPVLDAPMSSDDVSPENLMAETLSDRLKTATYGRGKAIAVSGKARSAVAMAGRLGQAYWVHEESGKFVSGTFYFKELPPWVRQFNERKLLSSYLGKPWTLTGAAKEYSGEDNRAFESDWHGLGRIFPHPVNSLDAVVATPYLNDAIAQMAKEAIVNEQLGKDEIPDLLSVSFSGIDRVYHLYGPYSWEIQDAMVRLDKTIADLISAAEKAAGGRNNLVVALSADHGGAAIPEEWTAQGLRASRVSPVLLQKGLSKELISKFGIDPVLGIDEVDLYLSSKAATDIRIDPATIRRAAAQWLSAQPSILTAVAKDDLWSIADTTGYLRTLRVGYYPERSGDVLFLLRPFQVLTSETTGTSHGTVYAYDSQVPVVFFGKSIKPGLYRQEIHPTDIAPTLASLMEFGPPASCEGTTRAEALVTSGR